MTASNGRTSGPSREARQLAAVLLDVLAGARTPLQAAVALRVSLPRYYQLEERGMAGLVAACEARPRGRRVDGQARVDGLTKEIERLKKELVRQQSLVRLTQRTVGVAPPAPAKTPPKRKRQPSVRAMRRAEQLRTEEEESTDTPVSSKGTD